MFIAELEHPSFREFDLTSLRTGIIGGAPCPVEVMRRVDSQMHMHEVAIEELRLGQAAVVVTA